LRFYGAIGTASEIFRSHHLAMGSNGTGIKVEVGQDMGTKLQ